ncbi:uncharacterized protein K460DRAFT_331904 [Cucurbitaria berberidis CBS 394.84]|uniref:AAA+ ATPase domain-containing protein n=1 Tax=Cucurbitaria berberidis CBS 394.84 TaxID=1168544 RepID=A0A9P4GJ51_9PLEO|nr:uncharacterized protein K460DRAFT_331904 [Cucurbitaria berberidis CBS 394.84]KAF1847173.1 hypothetical protein K460DRAFT_331904 [Cucurbitaria berberidis CBS 394.84]
MNLEAKSLHPFFSKPPKNHAPDQVPDQAPRTNDQPVDDAHDDPDYGTSPKTAQGRKKKTRKAGDGKERNTGKSGTLNQISLDTFTRPRAQDATDTPANGYGLAEASLDEDPNRDRRKRRKTASPELSNDLHTSVRPITGQLDWQQQLQAEAAKPMTVEEPLEGTVDTDTPMSNTLHEQPQNEAEAMPRPSTPPPTAIFISSDPVVLETKAVTPKKQIKVTKSGKLLSSPPKHAPEPSSVPRKRRGRKPAKPKVSPTVTVIRYGVDAANKVAIGQRIEEILNGKKLSIRRAINPKKVPPKPAAPRKVTHPFFLGKPGTQKDAPPMKTTSEQLPPTPRRSAVTPGKLRAEARRDRSPKPTPAFGMPAGRSRVTNQSGLNEASWPTRETSHVRNLDDVDWNYRTRVQRPSTLVLRPRKLKSIVTYIPDSEDVITRLAQDLSQAVHRAESVSKSEFEPPEDVRLPTRLLTTGTEIQRRVCSQIHAVLPKPGELHQLQTAIHPAITTLFNDIERVLTPFDEGRCEGQPWTHKYGPKCASHVLQPGNEAAVLKDWLQSLTVLAVGGALKSSTAVDIKRPPKKKRKKAVDDFIVSDDDEEDGDMMECSDREGTAVPHLKSLRRPQWTRNKNVILLSGPHGCGKSATVYAVAEELGFEVFEINPGTRRSGKDIQDKVGDMTANHLVNHQRSAAPAKEDLATDNDTDNERMNTALQEDLNSGRQGTMTSFFQTNIPAKANSAAKVKVQEPKKAPTHADQTMLSMASTTRKSQKQSLILFEEADILFEEDQQFWAQVTKLALSSKRPIVITCNDERQIPSQDLPLAAVLRLHPPPVDLATDYLLVLAGREGHILERKAVSDLYHSKNYDLRASITELNLWCQMSVGDRKGGLEWIYQRWPRGRDVDSHGRLLRVASEGTYLSGMGWFSHNVFETRENITFDKEEELLKEACADWDINPIDWVAQGIDDERTIVSSSDEFSCLKNLECLDALSESLSAADVYCRVGLPAYESDYHQPTDSSLPPITDKARLSVTLAAPLLQVDHPSDFTKLDSSIFTQTHLLIKRAYPDFSHPISSHRASKPTTETDYANKLLRLKVEQKGDNSLARSDCAIALDILAVPPDFIPLQGTSYNLMPSSFDRTLSIITLDLAPYVRSIVAHEQVLETQRLRVSNLLSIGGNAKRPRTTRASRVALEGGVRETKRRDRWFDKELNFQLVMATAGKEWAGMGWKGEVEEGEEGTRSLTGTLDGSESAEDVLMQDSPALI